jgi:hypothetical protein
LSEIILLLALLGSIGNSNDYEFVSLTVNSSLSEASGITELILSTAFYY